MQKCKNCSCVCIPLCRTVVHNTAQSSSDYLPSYPPDKHQSSDAVYWRGGGIKITRSSATADEPWVVLCQFKSCQLLHSCTKNHIQKCLQYARSLKVIGIAWVADYTRRHYTPEMKWSPILVLTGLVVE